MKRRLSPDAMYPASEPDVRVRMVRIGDDLRVRVLELGPPDGEPTLLVHGWAACAVTYRHLLRALAAAGRRAIAVDLPGHGLSDKPRSPDAYTSRAVVSQITRLLDELALDRVDLVGHSLGGSIVLDVALADPDRVGRLVLAAPTGLVNVRMRLVARCAAPPVDGALAAHIVLRPFVVAVLRGVAANQRAITPALVDEYWAPSADPGYYVATRTLLRVFDWSPIPPARLASFRHPMLVLLGARDPLLPGAHRAARSLFPHATVEELPRTGHLVFDERSAEACDATIRFLAAARSRGVERTAALDSPV